MNSVTTGGLVRILHAYFMRVMMAALHSNEAEKVFAPVKCLVCTGTQQLQMPFQNWAGRNACASVLCFCKPQRAVMSRHLASHVIQSQYVAYLPCLLLLTTVKQRRRKLNVLPGN